MVLGATARVEGNVYYGVIEMTLGAQIMGKLVRLAPEKGEAPVAAATARAEAPEAGGCGRAPLTAPAAASRLRLQR